MAKLTILFHEGTELPASMSMKSSIVIIDLLMDICIGLSCKQFSTNMKSADEAAFENDYPPGLDLQRLLKDGVQIDSSSSILWP